jgi:hypothetical protein
MDSFPSTKITRSIPLDVSRAEVLVLPHRSSEHGSRPARCQICCNYRCHRRPGDNGNYGNNGIFVSDIGMSVIAEPDLASVATVASVFGPLRRRYRRNRRCFYARTVSSNRRNGVVGVVTLPPVTTPTTPIFVIVSRVVPASVCTNLATVASVATVETSLCRRNRSNRRYFLRVRARKRARGARSQEGTRQSTWVCAAVAVCRARPSGGAGPSTGIVLVNHFRLSRPAGCHSIVCDGGRRGGCGWTGGTSG